LFTFPTDCTAATMHKSPAAPHLGKSVPPLASRRTTFSERSVPFVTGQLALIHVLSNAFTPVDLADMPSKPPGSHETWQNGTAARCGVPG
jgi:hypothetical protein